MTLAVPAFWYAQIRMDENGCSVIKTCNVAGVFTQTMLCLRVKIPIGYNNDTIYVSDGFSTFIVLCTVRCNTRLARS